MRIRSGTTRLADRPEHTSRFQGCGSEGIDAPVPAFEVPPSMDPVAGKSVAQAFEQLQNNSDSIEAWRTLCWELFGQRNVQGCRGGL